MKKMPYSTIYIDKHLKYIRTLLENANQISPEKPCIEPAACPLVGAASAANG